MFLNMLQLNKSDTKRLLYYIENYVFYVILFSNQVKQLPITLLYILYFNKTNSKLGTLYIFLKCK